MIEEMEINLDIENDRNKDSYENLKTEKEVNILEVFLKKKNEFEKSIQDNIKKLIDVAEHNGPTLELEIRRDQLTKKLAAIKLDRDQYFGPYPEKFVELNHLENLVDETIVKIELVLRGRSLVDKNKIGLDLESSGKERNSEGLSNETSQKMMEESTSYADTNPIGTKKQNLNLKKDEVESEKDGIFCSLKKVNFPVFSGNINEYLNWANAFDTFIDKSNLSPEIKLLHLRQYLSGEAAKLLEGVGYNADAYEIAKNRLGRRYGGERRKVGLFLEEVEKFDRIKQGNAIDLERFSNFLDVLVLNLKDSGLASELGSGLLYVNLQKKMHKDLISRYHRWLHEKKLVGNVFSLRMFILLESEFEIIAEETAKGFSKVGVEKSSFFVSRENNEVEDCHAFSNGEADKNVFLSCHTKQAFSCCICGELHREMDCPELMNSIMDVRQKLVMKYGLCFGCLERGHKKKNCKHETICQNVMENTTHFSIET